MGGEGRTGDTPSERGVTLQRPRSLSCALIHGVCQVYDVSHFLKEHPGGAAIVIPHLGTDIDDVFEDGDLHMHSRAAHAMLLRFQIGVLAGAHSAERKRDGDGDRLYIDWSKPIVCQIGQLGERYNEFIHSPQVLDAPARFFQSNLLEALSRTPWYVVPIVWVPVIAGMLLFASTLGVAPLSELAIFSCGLALWTLIGMCSMFVASSRSRRLSGVAPAMQGRCLRSRGC